MLSCVVCQLSYLSHSYQIDVPTNYNGVDFVNITWSEVKDSSGANRYVPDSNFWLELHYFQISLEI